MDREIKFLGLMALMVVLAIGLPMTLAQVGDLNGTFPSDEPGIELPGEEDEDDEADDGPFLQQEVIVGEIDCSPEGNSLRITGTFYPVTLEVGSPCCTCGPALGEVLTVVIQSLQVDCSTGPISSFGGGFVCQGQRNDLVSAIAVLSEVALTTTP